MSQAAATAAAATLTDTKEAVLETLPMDPLKTEIARLREEQARVRKEKKDLSKALRNATKKQQRLRKRTRLMTDEDLVAVLLMRKGSSQASGSKTDAGPSADAVMASGSSGSARACATACRPSPQSVDRRALREEETPTGEVASLDPDGDAER